MRKLAVIFSAVGGVALLVSAVAVLSLWVTLLAKQRLVLAYEDVATDADQLVVASERRARRLRTSALTRKDVDVTAHREARQDFEEALRSLQDGFGAEALRDDVRRIRAADDRLTAQEDELVELVRTGRSRQTIDAKLMADVLSVREDLDEAVARASGKAEQLVTRARQDSDRTDRLAMGVLAGTVFLAFVVILTMALFLRQVTRRLAQAEGELRRTAEFQQRLMGIVGHDLRAPLSAIVTSATLLPSHEGEAMRYADLRERILRNAGRMDRLVESLMDVTRVQVGLAIPVVLRPIDIHELVGDLVQDARMANKDRRVEHERFGDGHGQLDPHRVAQIVTNLLSNALKYSPPRSTVRVVTRGEPEWLEIGVHNEDHVAERLPFEPFVRGAGKEPAACSVGLGLFVSRHLAEAHGGTIRVESSEETGTTFRVRLPRERREVEVAPPHGEPVPAQ